MSRRALVSVIIPTYNRPEFLRKAIASVRAQEGVDTEIIVVDDASEQDLTTEFEDQADITYLRNEKNCGGGYSRNRGLEEARGEFVNFLDDDDEFLPGKLQKQVQKFMTSEVPNLGLVTCDMRDLRSGEEVTIHNRDRGEIYYKSLKGYTAKGTPTMLFKTQAVRNIGGFDTSLPSSQEYDLIIRFSKQYQVDFVDEVLTQANRSVDQINLNFEKKRAGAIMLFNKYDEDYRARGFIFQMRMRLKLNVLLFRFWVGKRFGESAYKLLLR